MKAVKILWLDCYGREKFIERQGHEVLSLPTKRYSKFVLDSGVSSSFYNPPGLFLDHLETDAVELAREADCIVVGNNCGGGEKIAEILCRVGLKDKVVVVWNYYPARNETLFYESLGIHGFASRVRGDSNLAEFLKSIKKTT